MKALSLIFFCLSLSTVLAKTYSLSVKVIALDTHTSLEGANVVFSDKRGHELFKTVTDKNGKATYPKCKSSKLSIVVSDAKNYYQVNTTQFIKKYDGIGEQKVYLRLPEDKERSLIALKTAKISIDTLEAVEYSHCPDSLVGSADFPVGMSELRTFLATNIQYPQEAIEMGIRGKCYVKFIIDKEGNVSGVSLAKGVLDCPECDAEAIRVLCYMPKWKPGSCGGKNYATYYNLPITFSTR